MAALDRLIDLAVVNIRLYEEEALRFSGIPQWSKAYAQLVVELEAISKKYLKKVTEEAVLRYLLEPDCSFCGKMVDEARGDFQGAVSIYCSLAKREDGQYGG